uniref:AH domain-containing protein n=1 Tax=Trichuris muris TaxID=70415 RepID=A0A5S6Q9R6_TRIMR
MAKLKARIRLAPSEGPPMPHRDYYSFEGTNDNGSAMEKLRQQYWTTRQTFRRRLGQREDEYLVASDAELDMKVQVYESLKSTCNRLLLCIENYQEAICDLAQIENAFGRFLKHEGKADSTQAGKTMASVGRAQSSTAQQRLALRQPLARLFADLEVFTDRAVADCGTSVEGTELARQRYRGSLLWMGDVSRQLDPDVYKQLEQFRKVQAQVRRNKQRLDLCKLKAMQKIDLLVASRCNLFSKLMTSYQNGFLRFWDKTCAIHCSIANSLKGYQYYEFTLLKDLMEPCQKLLEVTEKNDEAPNPEMSYESDDEHRGNGEVPTGELIRTKSIEDLFRDSPEKCTSPTKTEEQDTVGQEKDNPLLDVMEKWMPSSEAQLASSLFTEQWNDLLNAESPIPVEGSSANASEFSLLPSDLLDSHLTATSRVPERDGGEAPQSEHLSADERKQRNWSELFADLDPLRNKCDVNTEHL